MKTEQTCKTCRRWAPVDGRKFIGICGHPDHGGEMTDRTEGGNCSDFEPAELVLTPEQVADLNTEARLKGHFPPFPSPDDYRDLQRKNRRARAKEWLT